MALKIHFLKHCSLSKIQMDMKYIWILVITQHTKIITMPLPEVQTFAIFFLVVLKEIFFIVEKLSVLEQELLYSKAQCILYNWTSIKIYLLLKIHEKEANIISNSQLRWNSNVSSGCSLMIKRINSSNHF